MMVSFIGHKLPPCGLCNQMYIAHKELDHEGIIIVTCSHLLFSPVLLPINYRLQCSFFLKGCSNF